MANNYQQFSEQMQDLTKEERDWVSAFLSETAPPIGAEDSEYYAWCEARNIAPHTGECEYCPGFSWSLESDHLNMWSEESGDLEHLADFVQKFLKKFRPMYVFALTYATTCSSMRVGEFSGGWLVVSAKEIDFGNAYSGAVEAMKKLEDNLRTKRTKNA